MARPALVTRATNRTAMCRRSGKPRRPRESRRAPIAPVAESVSIGGASPREDASAVNLGAGEPVVHDGAGTVRPAPEYAAQRSAVAGEREVLDRFAAHGHARRRQGAPEVHAFDDHLVARSVPMRRDVDAIEPQEGPVLLDPALL